MSVCYYTVLIDKSGFSGGTILYVCYFYSILFSTCVYNNNNNLVLLYDVLISLLVFTVQIEP